MMRLVPPAGAPLEILHIFRAVLSSWFADASQEMPLTALGPFFNSRYVFGISSGRAALWAILKALQKSRADRSVVVIPAYTCFSVPAAIVRAGLRIYPVDVNPETLDYDHVQLAALPAEGILCIITSNLFGLVNDTERIRSAARARGAALIDDAAQALGASRGGNLAGTVGDVGFFSFGRGKAMTTVEGGLIVTDSCEFGAPIQAEIEALPAPTAFHCASLLMKMLSYSVFVHPRLYWIPNSIPLLKLGVTEFQPDFIVADLPPFARALLPRLMQRLGAVNEVRRQNAAAIAKALENHPRLSLPRVARDCEPTYLRLPVIARDRATRDAAVFRMQRAGIGATPFYPSAICDIPGIAKHMATQDFHRPQAESLSQRLLTLPTHPYVRPGDLERMGNILNSL